MLSKKRRNWKNLRPTSISHAMELCLEHAKEKHNRSIDNVADLMGLVNKWTIYKWVENGKLPAHLITSFQAACGINFVTTWLASSDNKLLVAIPTGKHVSATSLAELQQSFSQCFTLLTKFYDCQSDLDDTLFALEQIMSDMGWHHGNVSTFAQPALDFSGEE